MQNIENILCPLLLRNDCVILPSLGGFVANYVSAKIDVNNGVILPPSKAVSFNKNLINNDGLIVNFLAKENNISYDQAQSIINTEILQIKSELNQGKRIHFPNVGFLYTNEAGKIAFEQDRFFNLLLASYGLKNVQFVPEEEEVVEPVIIPEESGKVVAIAPISVESTTLDETPVEVETPIVALPVENPEKPKRSVVGRIVRYAAVAALVPFLFYSFWIPMKTDYLNSGILYVDDFNPFKKSVTAEYNTVAEKSELKLEEVKIESEFDKLTENLEANAEYFSYPLADDLFVHVKNKEIVDNTAVENLETPVTTEEIVDVVVEKVHNLHAIAGCFSESSNANNFVESLKAMGFDAYEVDVKGGLHRISAGNVQSMEEMSTLRARLSEKDLSSWVLKK